MKKLIVNADDFGLDDETTAETIRCFDAGVISSATIMAGFPGTACAIEYAKAHPQFSFGVHFYIVDETPLSRPEDIPSIIDPKTGKLWTTRQFIVRNFLGLVKVEDLVREMSAQYDALAKTGLKISHVDGHGHNHRLPQSIRALEALKKARGIDVLRVRRCQDFPPASLGLLSRLINGPMQGRLSKAGFRMTDHFAMMCGKTDDPKWFSRLVASLPDGVTEIGIHPGRREKWREVDSRDCLENGLAAYASNGITLVNYNDL